MRIRLTTLVAISFCLSRADLLVFTASAQEMTLPRLVEQLEKHQAGFDHVKFRARVSLWMYDDVNGRKWSDGSMESLIWRKGDDIKVEMTPGSRADNGTLPIDGQFIEKLFLGREFVSVQSDATSKGSEIRFLQYAPGRGTSFSALDSFLFGEFKNQNIGSELRRFRPGIVQRSTSGRKSFYCEWSERATGGNKTTGFEFSDIQDRLVITQINDSFPTGASLDHEPTAQEIETERQRNRLPHWPAVSVTTVISPVEYSEIQGRLVPSRVHMETTYTFPGNVKRRSVCDESIADVEFDWDDDPATVFAIKTPIPNKTPVTSPDGMPFVWQDGKVVKALGVDTVASLQNAEFSPPRGWARWRTPSLVALVTLGALALGFAWRRQLRS